MGEGHFHEQRHPKSEPREFSGTHPPKSVAGHEHLTPYPIPSHPSAATASVPSAHSVPRSENRAAFMCKQNGFIAKLCSAHSEQSTATKARPSTRPPRKVRLHPPQGHCLLCLLVAQGSGIVSLGPVSRDISRMQEAGGGSLVTSQGPPVDPISTGEQDSKGETSVTESASQDTASWEGQRVQGSSVRQDAWIGTPSSKVTHGHVPGWGRKF